MPGVRVARTWTSNPGKLFRFGTSTNILASQTVYISCRMYMEPRPLSMNRIGSRNQVLVASHRVGLEALRLAQSDQMYFVNSIGAIDNTSLIDGMGQRWRHGCGRGHRRRTFCGLGRGIPVQSCEAIVGIFPVLEPRNNLVYITAIDPVGIVTVLSVHDEVEPVSLPCQYSIRRNYTLYV